MRKQDLEKREFSQVPYQIFWFSSGALSPFSVFPAFSSPLITQSPLNGNALPSWTSSTPPLSWQLSPLRVIQVVGSTLEAGSTQGNKWLHAYQNSAWASLPPGSFPWPLPQAKVFLLCFSGASVLMLEQLSHQCNYMFTVFPTKLGVPDSIWYIIGSQWIVMDGYGYGWMDEWLDG